jgi:hypothetical protein
MPRPHEDRQRHTPADHHTGGPAIAFVPESWWAIAVAHVAAKRADAGTASYETLIEKGRTSATKVREAVVLRSRDRRRVLALLHLGGHEAFSHLSAAWDDHHLFAEHRAVAESRSLSLYRLAANVGDSAIDPASTDAYAFERVLLDVEHTRAVAVQIAAAPAFRGAAIFGTDDDRASTIIYRFAHVEEIEAFRATRDGQRALGLVAAKGDTFYPVQIVRTFA